MRLSSTFSLVGTLERLHRDLLDMKRYVPSYGPAEAKMLEELVKRHGDVLQLLEVLDGVSSNIYRPVVCR